MNNRLENYIDENIMEELKQFIIMDVKAGWLPKKEIRRDCIYFLEDYMYDTSVLKLEMFDELVEECYEKYKNEGTQTYFAMLCVIYEILESKGIVTEHMAGFTQDDGWPILNEKAHEKLENNEQVIGACFYTQQDLQRVIETGKLMFTYGNYFEKPTAKEIGDTIVEAIKTFNLEVEWDGSSNTRIAISNFKWDKQCRE